MFPAPLIRAIPRLCVPGSVVVSAFVQLLAGPTADSLPPPPLHSLDNIVVTATRTQRQADAIPTAVTVVDRQEIEGSPARGIDDLVMNKAGITVRRVVGMGEGIPGDISMRGVPGAYTAARVLVLVDGIPTNVSGAPFLVLNQVPNEMIERIEILKGPFSGLYGANAYNGVINIITRVPVDGPHIQVNYQFWPGLLGGVGASGGKHGESVSFNLGGGLRRVENYLAADSVFADGLWQEARNRTYRDERLMGKADIRISDRLDVTVQGRVFNSLLGYGMTATEPGHKITSGGRVLLAGPSLRFSASERLLLSAGGYLRRLEGRFLNQSWVADSSAILPTHWNAIADDGQLSLQGELKCGSHTVSAGADLLHNAISFAPTRIRSSGETITGGADESITNGGMYLQGEFSFFDAVLINPVARIDYHSRTGPTLSPKLAMAWIPTTTTRVRLSAGRGFRAPSLVELYMPEFILPGGTRIVPSDTLRPEHLCALDAGIDLTLPLNASLTLNGFYNSMKDLVSPWIVDLDLATLSGVLSYRNISTAWSAGCELEARITPLHWMSAAANYTFTLSEEDAIREPLDYIPRHKGGITLLPHAPIGPFLLQGELGWMYTGKRQFLDWQGATPQTMRGEGSGIGYPPAVELEGFSRFDASLRISTMGERVWAGIGATNLGNAQFEEHGGSGAPGRMGTLQLGVGW